MADERRIPSDRPIYVISIAAELASVHPQTLRMYERKQLIHPKRSSGRVRLYSEQDIEWVRQIQYLTQEVGINLAGVKKIIELQQELREAERRIQALREEALMLEERFRAEIADIMLRYSPQIIRQNSHVPAPRKRH